MSTLFNKAFLQLSRRAESYDRAHLVATFVDVGPLFTMLSNRDHQILYGRRGTGKTHVLAYLADTVESRGDLAIQIDMRTIGSSGGIYADSALTLSERATRLLSDTLGSIHEQLLTHAINDKHGLDLSRIGPALDELADSATEVKVIGTTSEEEILAKESGRVSKDGISLNILPPKASVSIQLEEQEKERIEKKVSRSGSQLHRVHFGAVLSAFTKLSALINGKRIWILLDEWSEVPLDLQPYLADLLRRSIFPVNGISVKIAAIEQRTSFRISDPASGYVGIEIGADAASSLSLDDFMVFENESERAKEFFETFLYKHALPFMEGGVVPAGPSELVRMAFTQSNAFDEFVRAAEGVPRDAINIVGLAAQRATEQPISVPDVRIAARQWYQRGKERAVHNPKAQSLLRWIVDEVIKHRRARAFMVRSDMRSPLIDYLFDARVLHVVKQGVSTHEQPGVRYDVYSIDYGCYVDLINTKKTPLGLFYAETEDGERFVDVPGIDYRSIRRAILDIERFEKIVRSG